MHDSWALWKYLIYEHYGAPRFRQLVPVLLCITLILLLPLNIDFGLQYEAWYHQRADTFAETKGGIPIDQLADDRPVAPDATEMYLGMGYPSRRT